MQFFDRTSAGKELGAALSGYADRQDVVLLALPRGGVPVAAEVARALRLPLDVMLVRKLGVPGQEELAMGAISIGDVCVLNEFIIGQLNLCQADVDHALVREQAELKRRNQLYRGGRPMPKLDNKAVIVIDDGLATGATMQAAISALKQLHAREIIVATPVGATETCSKIEVQVDKLFCLFKPDPFWGVGHWYRDFQQITDTKVNNILDEFHPIPAQQTDENSLNPTSISP